MGTVIILVVSSRPLKLLVPIAALLAVAAVLASAIGGPSEPTPPAPPAEGLVWKADASRPLDQEWASYATADACFEGGEPLTAPGRSSSRALQTDRVAPPGERRSYLMRLVDGDECSGERTELGQSNPPKPGFEDRLFRRGDDLWIGYRFLIPSGRFPTIGTWSCLVQLKGEGPGGPVFCPSLVDDRLGLGHIGERDSASVGGYDLWRHDAPVVRDRWISFLFHIRFDPDPSLGSVELFADLADGQGMRVRVPRTSTFTMKVRDDGTPTPVHARIGIYRDRAAVGDAEMYYGGFAVGRNRAVVEYEAFGLLPDGSRAEGAT